MKSDIQDFTKRVTSVSVFDIANVIDIGKRGIEDFTLQNFTSKHTAKITDAKFKDKNVSNSLVRLKVNFIGIDDKLSEIAYSKRKLTKEQEELKTVILGLFKSKPIWIFTDLLTELRKRNLSLISTYNVKTTNQSCVECRTEKISALTLLHESHGKG